LHSNSGLSVALTASHGHCLRHTQLPTVPSCTYYFQQNSDLIREDKSSAYNIDSSNNIVELKLVAGNTKIGV
jgi:hypothetical protein